MSWFDKVKAAAAVAADSAQKAAASVVESTKKTYEELKAAPTEIQCRGCFILLAVPSNLFDWECTNKHVNEKNASICATCQAPKTKGPEPALTCPGCGTVTVVPSTNASKSMQSAAQATKTFANQAVATSKEQIKYLSSAPSTFHCVHCNALLAVPSGPWACQTCTTENPEECKQCSQCKQKKSEQKAICGVCRQSTNIPSTNFFDGLSATSRDLYASTRKVYFDVSGKPYVTCSRCSFHIPMPGQAAPGAAATPSASSSTTATSDSIPSPSSAAASSEGDVPLDTLKEAAPTPDSSSSSSSSSSTSSTGAPQPIAASSTTTIECPKCKNVM